MRSFAAIMTRLSILGLPIGVLAFVAFPRVDSAYGVAHANMTEKVPLIAPSLFALPPIANNQTTLPSSTNQTAIDYYNQGNTLAEQGNVEAAIVAYKTAIALDPENADAHYNLGYWLAHQGQLEAAEVSYWQASQLAPFDAEIYYNLGLVLSQQSFFESAEVALQRALLLAPENTHIREAITALPNQQGTANP